MTLQTEILALINKPTLATLATITEEGKPWTRYVVIFADDDLTIRCATFANARKVSHIRKNPEVHLTCGVTDLEAMLPYLQMQGKATFTTDKKERHAFWNNELSAYFKGPDDPNYGVIIIKPYRIELMEPGKFEPKVWEAL